MTLSLNPSSRSAWLAVWLLIPTAVGLSACGEGTTPTCPPMPLFDVREAEERNAARVVEWRKAGAAAGCVTPLPVRSSPAGTGGVAGAGGAGGASDGGSAGSGGKN